MFTVCTEMISLLKKNQMNKYVIALKGGDNDVEIGKLLDIFGEVLTFLQLQ